MLFRGTHVSSGFDLHVCVVSFMNTPQEDTINVAHSFVPTFIDVTKKRSQSGC